MEKKAADLFIIGGGINGVGIAADASGRGLSVVLCEQNDLASATSSASTKLIHGGLRYLENYEFNLVRKALTEREILLKLAPHLIHPMEFVTPHENHLRPAWLIQMGLFLYDHLASHPSMPNSKKINLSNDRRGNALQSSFKKGFSYFDCATDDARLVVLNAIAAKKNGAMILTRNRCVAAEYNQIWKLTLQNIDSGETRLHYAKVLVNASGPWVSDLHKQILPSEKSLDINLVKGSHLVVPKLYDGEFAYLLQNNDKRVVFVIPYQQHFSLVGTTDVAIDGNLNQLTISPTEQIYLCDTVNKYFNKKISSADIVWSYAGVRTLQADHSKTLSSNTRDYKTELHSSLPLLTVISGKLTTYRCLAEHAVDSLSEFFSKLPPSHTIQDILPGGNIPDGNFKYFFQTLKHQYSFLPDDMLLRYATNYGTRVEYILKDVSCLDDLGYHFSNTLYQKEVEYLIQHEWAMTCDDILWRRTKLGLFFSSEEVNRLKKWLSQYFLK